MKITSRCKVKEKIWKRQTFNMLFFCSIQPFIYCRYQSINFLNKKPRNMKAASILYSSFASSEVKEFKEVREVKAICFTAKSSTKKAVGYNF